MPSFPARIGDPNRTSRPQDRTRIGTPCPLRSPGSAAQTERLSTAMKDAISSVEAELPNADTSMWRWTLTWLGGHPVAELEDGTIVREDYDGSVVVTAEDLDL